MAYLYSCIQNGPTFFLTKVEIKQQHVTLLSLEELDHHAIKQFFESLSPHSILVTALPGHQTMIRMFSSSLKKKQAIYEALPFEIEKYIHGQLEDFVVIPEIFKQDHQFFVSNFICVRKSLEAHISKWREYGIDPPVVSSSYRALQMFAKEYFSEYPSFLVIHLDYETLELVFLKEGRIEKALSIPFGWKDIFLIAKEETPELSEKELLQKIASNEFGTQALLHAYDKVKHGMKKIDYALYSFFGKGKDVYPCITTGYATKIYQFDSKLHKMLTKEITFVSYPQKEPIDFQKLKYFAIPIGLTFEQANVHNKPLQFRQKNYTPRLFKQKVRNRLLFIVILGFCLNGGLFYFFKQTQKKQSTMFQEQVSSFAKKYPHLLKENQIQLDCLSLAFSQAEKALRKEQKQFRYFSPPPNMSVVLSKILAFSEIERQEVLLEEFSYELPTYPKISEMDLPYKQKISLVVVAKDPLQFRMFYEHLKQTFLPKKPDDAIRVNRKKDTYEIGFTI